MASYFSFVFDGINRLLNQHAAFFEGMGMNLFRSFALILLSWFGIQSALASAEGRGGFPWARFATFLQQLSIVYVMLAFYSVPIPGVGISFTHVILDQVTAMVAQLDQARLQQLMETLNKVETNIPYPSPLEILAIIRYFILLLCILAAQAVTLYVVMFGYIATSVCVLLGPVFIPFKIVPEMDWLFWGWLRAFMQFAFYQLVATAYVYVFAEPLLQILGAQDTALSAADLGYMFIPIALLLVTFTLGTIKVPALTFSLFSGRSGEYVLFRWK